MDIVSHIAQKSQNRHNRSRLPVLIWMEGSSMGLPVPGHHLLPTIERRPTPEDSRSREHTGSGSGSYWVAEYGNLQRPSQRDPSHHCIPMHYPGRRCLYGFALLIAVVLACPVHCRLYRMYQCVHNPHYNAPRSAVAPAVLLHHC